MAEYAGNPSIHKAEARRLSFQASLGYIVRFVSRNSKEVNMK
jgi:hypothetical protein